MQAVLAYDNFKNISRYWLIGIYLLLSRTRTRLHHPQGNNIYRHLADSLHLHIVRATIRQVASPNVGFYKNVRGR